MTEYRIPTASSETEFTEKRSRFIGHVWRVESEEEARAHIEEMKKRYHDARHNCWCYLIREGGIVRYSDDGEPQGTAGQPMLGVFQKEEITNVCCVVTRYFGGVLLGAGGLVRAYTRSAKDALDAAGISVVRRWAEVAVPCPYALFERMKLEVESAGGVLGETEYGADVTIHALLPEWAVEDFTARVTELTAGGCAAQVVGEAFRDVPWKAPSAGSAEESL
ncbi:YigZ family protein [Flavonifractor sp. An135]|nr:YigZ family protein [Flavonifractor sp. An135]OUQ24514.1 YigZ family protein [Flavonifractor sp. An135]